MNLSDITAHGITTHTFKNCNEVYVDYPSDLEFRSHLYQTLSSLERKLPKDERLFLKKFSYLKNSPNKATYKEHIIISS